MNWKLIIVICCVMAFGAGISAGACVFNVLLNRSFGDDDVPAPAWEQVVNLQWGIGLGVLVLSTIWLVAEVRA